VTVPTNAGNTGVRWVADRGSTIPTSDLRQSAERSKSSPRRGVGIRAGPNQALVVPRLDARKLAVGVQAKFDDFSAIFNDERPHEALDMKCPAEVYRPSTREYKGLPDIDYPFHDRIIIITRCGRICLGTKKINFSTVFAGQAVGIKEVHDNIWLVSFMDYDLGYFDLETRVLEPLDNPFGPRLSPM